LNTWSKVYLAMNGTLVSTPLCESMQTTATTQRGQTYGRR